MHKPGVNPDHVQMSDVLCDFCRADWTGQTPFVEGHHGSIVCGKCLTVAYMQVVTAGESSAPEGSPCTMCLENRPEPAWRSPLFPEAVICRSCIKLGAGTLERDSDYQWKRPGKE